MDKGKIITLNDCHLNKLNNKPGTTPLDAPISEELQTAIQHLIHRLRELGPLIP